MTPASPSHLFAYGTLVLPAIYQRVTGFSRIGIPVRVTGYARYALKGLSYPGLVPEPGGSASGVLYQDLESEEWRRLDAFEDDFYVRERVAVADDRGRELIAQVYLIRPDRLDLVDSKPWSLDAFVADSLTPFLARISGE